jgi:hypothetical protein
VWYLIASDAFGTGKAPVQIHFGATPTGGGLLLTGEL